MGKGKLEMTVVNRFIFDVDGTLTPSRGLIDKEFEKFFLNFCNENYVYLVTGSDHPKTVEQLGKPICKKAVRVYNCSGSDVWEQGKNVRTSNWTLPKDVEEWLSGFLLESKFVLRTGLHFEHRPGMCNFSIVGRNATLGERKLYVEYDKQNNERNMIARMLTDRFNYVDAKVGGETGIDLFAKNHNKAQILPDFDPINDILHFFGDAMHKEGNDYPLKKQIIDKDLGFCYNVKDYKETWKILRDKFSI
jgi:phosphomannomutase